jgi:hypothetical protein
MTQSVKEWRRQEQMFSLFNPWLIIGAVCAILGVYFYGHHNGYEERVAEDQAEIVRLNDEARSKEAELNTKLKSLNKSLQKATNEINSNKANINARIDAGELRLPTSCAVQASTDAGAGNTANAGQSDRQAIKALADIAADGDIAITQLNACIDTYNKVREAVNVKP